MRQFEEEGRVTLNTRRPKGTRAAVTVATDKLEAEEIGSCLKII